MRSIPFLTSDSVLFDRVHNVLRSCGFGAGLVLVPSAEAGLSYLDVEMPDLAFVHFSDPAFDGFALLDAVVQDPWLHYAGIVGFCGTVRASRALEKRQGVNLVACIDDDDIESLLPAVLGVLSRNERILFQRGLGAGLMQTISGSFEIPNSLVEVNCYANLVCNFLFNTGRIDSRAKMQINIALVEMLINAVEHGNCGITRQEKKQWLDEGRAMREMIALRCEDEAIAKRRVLFEYQLGPTESSFLIADQGAGFDWRSAVTADPYDFESPNGRGIAMTRQLTPTLRYNERGNEVSFEIEHQDQSESRPALFESITPRQVEVGEEIFREGEPGDHLYYIVKGRFDVLVRDRVVATMTPDDLIMGEMAFLLDNRRTATVRAATPGALLPLSKTNFVEALKRRPHYGIFLARLLARRLERIQGEDSKHPG